MRAWVNGSFYLVVFAVVIAGLCVLKKFIPLWGLPIVLVSGVVFVLLISTLHLRYEGRLTEKSLMESVRMIIQQLPLIGRLARGKKSEADSSEGEV